MSRRREEGGRPKHRWKDTIRNDMEWCESEEEDKAVYEGVGNPAKSSYP